MPQTDRKHSCGGRVGRRRTHTTHKHAHTGWGAWGAGDRLEARQNESRTTPTRSYNRRAAAREGGRIPRSQAGKGKDNAASAPPTTRTTASGVGRYRRLSETFFGGKRRKRGEEWGGPYRGPGMRCSTQLRGELHPNWRVRRKKETNGRTWEASRRTRTRRARAWAWETGSREAEEKREKRAGGPSVDTSVRRDKEVTAVDQVGGSSARVGEEE